MHRLPTIHQPPSVILLANVRHKPRTLQARKPIYDDDFDVSAPVRKETTSATLPPPPSATAPETEAAPAPVAAVTDAIAAVVSTPSAPPPATTPASSFGDFLATRQHGPTPTDRLAAQIRRARLFLYQQTCTAEDAVNAGMSKAFDLEQSFTSTVASLAPPRASGEKLMPGLVYTLVAGMAGSIVARNRGVILRGATPLAFGLGCAWTVIPITMQNVSSLLWKYEQRFPAVADAHVRTREGIEQGIYFARVHSELAQRKVTEAVTDVRETVEGWVRKGK